MSFDIPIIFDDSLFFDWGEMRRPQGRPNYQNSSRRQPSVFGQWVEPEFFNEYPTRKQHYRPNYGERQRGYDRQSGEENRFEDEGAQEDIYDTEEHRRTPKGNFGYDGWDIPVQYMDKPSQVHHKHKHKHKPKSSKTHQDINNDSTETADLKQSQRELSEGIKTNEIPSNTENTTERSNGGMTVRTDKQSKTIPEEQNMKRKSNENPDTEGSSQTTETSSQTTESENNESTEIPIAYNRPKNTHRRLSKRLSQCDPPSPADIKLARIKSIVQKTEGIEEKIAQFVDPVQNKNYVYIIETLMKILLDLDTVDSEGFDIVRKARKEGVRTVQALVDKLENKLEENKGNSKAE